MDNFVGGVWDDYRLTARERAALAGAERLHVVLVEGAIAELARLAADGALRESRSRRTSSGSGTTRSSASPTTMAPRRPRVHRLAGRRGRAGGRGHARASRSSSARCSSSRWGSRRSGSSTVAAARRRPRAALSRCTPVEVAGNDARLRRRVHRLVPRRAVALRRPRRGRRAGHDWRRAGHRVAAPAPRRRLRPDDRPKPPLRRPDAPDPPPRRARRLRAGRDHPRRPDPGDEDRARFDGGLESTRQVNANRGLVGYTGTVDGRARSRSRSR